MTKHEIRTKILAINKEQCKKFHSFDFATNICKYMVQIPQFIASNTVFLYQATAYELSTSMLISYCIKNKKQLAFPKVEKGASNMDFYYISNNISIEKQFSPGYCKILEPISSCKKLELENLKTKAKNEIIIIVPGVAFSFGKDRLGHGMGFYDNYLERLIKHNIKVTKIGICYDWQILESIPTQSHDIKMDIVVTPSRIIQ